MNILFVCTGNTCRSPMAEAIMNKIAEENELNISTLSAGIFANEENSASDEAVAVMKKYGIDISAHKARPLTNDMLLNSDAVLVMTEAHKKILEPLAEGKVFTLAEYAGESGDIFDPYGGDEEEYEEAAEEIYDYLTDIAEKLADMEL